MESTIQGLGLFGGCVGFRAFGVSGFRLKGSGFGVQGLR